MYLLTERGTSIAVKITPTGGYAFENKYQMADRVQIDRDLRETYQPDGPANGCRELIYDLDGRDQPGRQSVTAILRLARSNYQRSKYGEDSIWKRVKDVK